MDYEQIVILRDQVNDLDDIIRERQAELRALDASAEALTPEQAARRETLLIELPQFEAQKKELSDLLMRGLAGF